ncbi:unnamed protein product [Acanthoscelides obtectus]|uniref:C2H2-type domain-containing protein n=1 Tax=Acanthoscelides obtectus TaxID=200917 RepID=A0A9P0PA07_ACAOB|nr:unnamed protein product [Acanthoscelides obtectus]CAK1664801.1 Zinc finger protein PLAG1 [Acanthoscelides obtectus]
MGTPGDKCRRPASEAGEREGGTGGASGSSVAPPSAASVVKEEPPASPAAATAHLASLATPPVHSLALSPPIAAKPVFGGILPSPVGPHVSTSGKPIAFGAIQQDPTLQLGEQQPRTIEDYFQQSKFYLSPPGAVTATCTSPSTGSAHQQVETTTSARPSTSASVDQPGPSGLQQQQKSGVGGRGRHHKHRYQGTSQWPYVCHNCHRSFSSQDRLTRHQQTHSGSCPFKCEQCKKIFTSKFKLVRHALIHSDRRPFSCSVCDRTFHRKDHLKNHVKVHSPQKETYVCNQEGCKKQYTSYLSYRKHLAVHAAESGNLTCQICFESSFTTKEEILYHLKIHAGSRTVKNPAEKKFTCDYCDRKFFTKKDVRRHLVVHTGMRDFLCQFCPQRFGRKDHLVRHIKKSHHKQQKEETSTSTSTASIESPQVKVESAEQLQQQGTAGGAKAELVHAIPPETMLQQYHHTLVEEFGLKIFDEDFPAFLGGTEGGESSGDTSAGSIFLPSTSQPLEELKDLGEGVLEEIVGPSSIPEEIAPAVAAVGEAEEEPGPSTFPPHAGEVLLDSPQLFRRLLEPTQEKNMPLPGFKQTFQHSQQQQPPSSSGRSSRHQQPPAPPT